MPCIGRCWFRSWLAKRIRALETFIAETADRLWHEGVQHGTIEWMAAMANRLPMMIVGRLIGVPDEDIEQLVRWGYASTQVVEGLADQEQLAAAGVAAMELAGYINDHFQRAAADPKDNLLGDLATACAANELNDVAAQVDHDHAVQCRRRIHGVVDRLRGACPGEPSGHPTAGT